MPANAQASFTRNFNAWLKRWLEQDERRNDAAFARAVGLSKTTISQYKSGDAWPTLATVGPIADELGVHVWQLFEDPEDSKPVPKRPYDPKVEALRILADSQGYDLVRKRRPGPTS